MAVSQEEFLPLPRKRQPFRAKGGEGVNGYNTIAGITSVSTVTVNCNNNGRATVTPVTVSATAGNGTINQRQMVSGSNVLQYNLYNKARAGTYAWPVTASVQAH